MNFNKILAAVTLLFLCIASVFGAKLLRTSFLKPFDRNAARSVGPVDAPVQVIEHMDYQCHTCKQASGQIEKYLEEYPGTIRLQIQFHYFDSHPSGRKAAIFAECASHEGKFWPFHKLLFERQEDWIKAPNLDTIFSGYAKEMGIQNEKFQNCVDSLETLKTVKSERDYGTVLGVEYTPTFFINGKMAVGSEGFEKEIQSQLPRRSK